MDKRHSRSYSHKPFARILQLLLTFPGVRVGGAAVGVEVVGHACRLPGANNVQEFWALLLDQRCSVSRIPEERFSQNYYFNPRKGEPGKAYTFAAGVIDDIWGFDPAVFAITPREARQMDPQQRLVLQLTWEALEDAGMIPADLSHRSVGVYMGASSMDHSHRQYFDPAGTDSYLMTGNTLSLIANRVSYILDLKGPSLTFDTACSSSLVALDYALQDLRSGRVEAAIVGGVNALMSPFNFIGFCAASMLSPDGLCRPFDHRANGYVRAEGGVVLVLQRHQAPLTPQDPHCQILATGMNSDGRTPGVALPSSVQQSALLQRVYREAGVDPNRLAFVEAHGTGTNVGDPAEAHALGEALARQRSRPLPIGSAKSNVGHLEPASGLVGLLKAQLALEHGVYPATLHVERLNPHIDFAGLNLSVATEPLTLDGEQDAVAGVNNFGFGGTNVHVVLRRGQRRDRGAEDTAPSRVDTPPRRQESQPISPGPSSPGQGVLLLSAQSKAALSVLAERYRDLLERSAPDTSGSTVQDVMNASAHRRSRMRERLVVLGQRREDVQLGLAAFLEGRTPPNVISGSAPARAAKTVFVFSGNGAQWDGMGRSAFSTSAEFRDAFRAVDRCYATHAGWSLEELLFDAELAEKLRRTEMAQPLLFAVQVALAQSLMECGLRPSAVIGHSVGEVAAAHIAGALDLEKAVSVIRARSLHQEAVRELGLMAAVNVSAEEASALIQDNALAASVAAINSPRSITIAGAEGDVRRFLDMARQRQWAARVLDIDYPFHSAFLDPVREPLLADLAGLAPTNAQLAIYSTVTGDLIGGSTLGAEYWWRNVREPVRFEHAVGAAAAAGHAAFLEIGPRPVLRTYLTDSLAVRDVDARVVASLEAGESEQIDPVGVALARALVAGADFDADRLFGPPTPSDVALPLYPWQNTEYRLEPSSEALHTITQSEPHHPLLGSQLRPEDFLWECQLDTGLVPFLADHQVSGRTIMPGAGYVEMALSAARAVLQTDRIELRDMDFVRALELAPTHSSELRTRAEAESTTLVISSRQRLAADEFHPNVKARYARLPAADAPPLTAPPIMLGGDAPVDASIYRLAARFSLDYGPTFRRVTACREIGKSIVEVELADPVEDHCSGHAQILLHPTDLDAAFHGLNVVYARLKNDETKEPYVPVRIGALRLYRSHCRVRTVRIRLISYSVRAACASFELFASDGALIATAEDVRFKTASLGHKLSLDQAAYHFGFTASRNGLADVRTVVDPTGSSAEPDRNSTESAARAFDERSDTHLLLEIAARRVAYDVLSRLTGGERQIDLADLPGHADIVAGLASGLAGAHLATLEDGIVSIADACPLPPLDEIAHSILDHDPAWVADCTLLMRAAEELPQLVSAGAPPVEAFSLYTPELLEHYFCDSPSARAEHDALSDALQRVLAGWPQKRPLRILQLGAVGSRLTRTLVRLLDRPWTSLVVADTSQRRLTRIAGLGHLSSGFHTVALSSEFERLQELEPFDVVLSINGLHHIEAVDEVLPRCAKSFAPNATAIIAEADPSLFRDVVFCATPDWFAVSAGPDLRYGRLRSAEAWETSLRDCGFEVSRLPKTSEPGSNLLVGSLHPMPRENGPEPKARRLVVVADRNDAEPPRLGALVRGLVNSHHDTVLIEGSLENLRSAIESAAEDTDGIPEIVLVAGGAKVSPENALEVLEQRTHQLTRIFSSIKALPVRLWIIAEGGARAIAEAGGTCPVQTGIWSFARTAMNELHNLDIRLVDFASGMPGGVVAHRLASVISTPGDNREIILTDEGICTPEIRRGPAMPQAARNATPKPDGESGARQRTLLRIGRPGSLESLEWVSEPRREPGAGEVEIAVAATGLNFRDVMWSLGVLPEEALEGGFAGPTIGFECSGTVVGIGAGVEGLAVGDAVIAMAPASFASHVTVASDAVMHLPSGASLTDAATIPVSFLTAHYALEHLAHIEAGEWVLIHGAAGGVGLAAVQIAKHRGAKVIATAGNDEKRALLRYFGADHVLDTRSLTFVDRVREICEEGVDIVLNSLAGEAMERSLELLRPFGRFLELGKRDFYGNTKLGLRPLRRNISYFGIDADQLLVRRPGLARAMLRDIQAAFDVGIYRPLPYRQFESADVVEAFRLMQKSGHIGKILVQAPEAGIGHSAEPREFKASAIGTHVVLGGTGGFGLEFARWLAERGARRICVASRSGGDEFLIASVQAELHRRGIEFTAERCDVADRADVGALLGRLRTEGRIAGVALTAMVLDDGLIADLTPKRISAVLAPKVLGAQHLDQLTRGDDLDYFLLFSSAAAVFGNPGQASYVAANGYLDGLARARHQAGEKALSVAWGAITDVGVLTRQKNVADSLARHTGGQQFTARDALGLLACVLTRDDIHRIPHVALAAMNWSMATRALPIMATPVFALMKREVSLGGEGGSIGVDVRNAIDGLDDAAAKAVIAQHLAAQIAAVFHMPAEDIGLNRALTDLGMDSLMSVEFYMATERELYIQLPFVSITNGTTINDIAGKILQKLRNGGAEDLQSQHADILAKHVAGDVDEPALAALVVQVDERLQTLNNVM